MEAEVILRIKEISPALLSGLIIGCDSPNLFAKTAKVYSIAIERKTSSPLVIPGVPRNATVSAKIIATPFLIGKILTYCTAAQIAPAIIKAISINVIRVLAFQCSRNNAVHINGTPSVISPHSIRLLILSFRGVPLKWCHYA